LLREMFFQDIARFVDGGEDQLGEVGEGISMFRAEVPLIPR
jgi:hypothetical protein